MPNTPSPLGYSGNPLASDEPLHNRAPSPLDYSGSPLNLGLSHGPTSPLGLQAPQTANFDMAGAQQQIRNMFNAPMPGTSAPSTEPQIFFSPSTGDMVVNGFRFNQRNATQALASEQWATQPRQRFTLPDNATDWREMSRQEYSSYLDTIKNPGFGRRMSEAWEGGWRGFGDIALGAGRAIDRVTTGTDDNEWMRTASQNIRREYEENAPFLLGLRDVHDVGSGLTYLAQMSVQGVPWFVETIASMAAGALIGGAASGGVGAPAGAVEAFIAKEGLRQASRGAIESFLQNNIRRGAAAYVEAQAEHGVAQVTRDQVIATATRTGAASADEVNQFFNFGERAYHLTRADAAGASLGGGSGFAQAGQLSAMSASNYFTGVGDIRNSIEQAGGDPNSAQSVANIWAYAVPYAAIESMGDLLVTQPISHLVPGLESGGGSFLGNVARSGGLVAAGEGLEEGAQYITTQQAVSGATNRPIDVEPYDLLENIIGGAAAGGAMGAFTGAFSPTNGRITPDFRRPPAPSTTPTPAAPTPTPPVGLTPQTDPSVYEDPYALGNQSYDDVSSMGSVAPQYQASIDTTGYPSSEPQSAPPIFADENNPNFADMGNQEIPGANLAPSMPAERQVNTGNTAVAQVGDYVQWAPQGVMQWKEPRRVVSVVGDGSYMFVEGSDTGIPVNETTVESRAPRSAQPNYPKGAEQPTDMGGRINPAVEAAASRNPAIRKMVDTIQRANAEGVFISPENVANADLIPQEAMKKGFPPEHQAMALMAAGEITNSVRNHNKKMLAETLSLMSDAKNVNSWPVEKLDRAIKLSISGLVNMKGGFTEEQATALKKLGGLARAAKKAIPDPAVAGEQARKAAGKSSRALAKKLAARTPSQKKNAKRKANEQREREARANYQGLTRENSAAENPRLARELEERNIPTEGQDNRQASEIFAEAKKVKGAKGEALKKRNRIKEAGARIDEAAKAEPKVETKAQPKPKAAAESNDLKEAASIKRSNKTETHPIEPTSKVDEKRIDKAYTAGLKERETVNSLLQSIKALEGAAMRHQKKNPEFTNDTPYSRTRLKWPIIDGTALSLNELRALLIVVSKEDGKVNDPERRAIAFNETIKSIWKDIVDEIGPDAKIKGSKSYETAVERFVPSVKRQVSEVTNWLNAKISDLSPPVRGAAQQALAQLATQTDEKPKRGVDDEFARGSLTSSEREELRKLDEFIFAMYRPEQVPDAVLDRYNELAKRAPKGIILAGRPITRKELEHEQGGIDREVDEELDNSSYDDFLAESGEKPSNTELNKQYAKDLEELNTLRKQNTRNSNDDYDEKPKRGTNSGNPNGRPPTTVTTILREVLAQDPRFTFNSIHPATRERNKAVVERIHKAQDAAGETRSKVKNLEHNLTQLKKRLSRDKPQMGIDQSERYPEHKIPVNTPDGQSYILVNPSKNAVMGLLKAPFGKDKSKYDMGRYVLDANGNLFVGNGYFFIHDQLVNVVESTKIKNGTGNYTVAGYESDGGNRQMGHGEKAIASYFTRQDDKLVFSPYREVNEETLWPKRNKPQASTNEDNVLYKKVSVPVARAAVNKIQRMIAEHARFKSVSVVGNVIDLFDQLGDIVMTAPNGAKHTLLQYVMREAQIMKNENPSLKDISLESVGAYYIQTHMTASGIVIPGYQHLIIMADYLKDERRLYAILEHEYIVHSGLKALIPDPIKRALFLHRFSLVPGVHEMREYLLAQLPMYKNVSYLDQLEEVLAYQSMKGPLALEQLLKAEEGINQETRQTLWDEFVDIVKQWIKNTFGDKEADTRTLVMDDIIGALRQYAITGYMGDLEGVLDKYNVPNVDQDLKSAFIQRYESKIKRGFDTAEPINEKLFGTDEDNDPMRPYRKQSYPDYIKGVFQSNADMVEKLRTARDGGFTTPVKEQLKKLSREMETMNNMKLRSTLIEQVLEVMHNTIRVARRIMTESMMARPYAELSAHTAWLRRRFGDKRPGSTKAQRDAYSSLALAATNSKLAKITDEIVRAAPRILVRDPSGLYTINWDVFAQYDADGKLTGGLLKEGMFTRQEFVDGIPQFTVDSEGVVTQHGVAKFTEQQLNDGYEIYVAETKELGKSMMKIMEHTAIMLSRKNDLAIDKIMRDNRFKPEDEAFANEVLERMFKLYADIAFHDYTNISRKKRAAQAGRARQVLIELQRTFHEEEKVKDWTNLSRKREDVKGKNPRGNNNDAFKWREKVDVHEDVKPFVNQINWFLEYDPSFGDSRFARINSLGVSPSRQYAMLGVFQNLLNAETEAHERENKAIQSILGNYVEMTRKGKWRVAVVARDADGKSLDIPPDLYAVLPVTYTESKREADELQQRLVQKFRGEHYFLGDNGEHIPLTFDVSVRQAPGTQTMSDVPSIGEFLKVSEAVGLSLDAKQMKEIANMIESASIRKRYGLQRSATPGVDFDVLFNNNATLTGRAWQAAKISQSWMLDNIMSDPKNKSGDWNLLAKLQREFDLANRGAPEGVTPPASFTRNVKAVAIAERDLLRYANQLRHMAEHTTGRPTVDVRTTKGLLKLKIENESEAHLQHAQALQKSLEKNELEVNLNDLISKTGALRQQAVVMQLGTMASGIMNAFTPLTHLPWVLMARHGKTGYGEGFEFSEVISEIISAIAHVGDVFKNYNSAEELLVLLEDAKKGNNRTSLTVEELQFMYDETLDGILTPQQTYSMTGGTESNIRDLFWRNASKVALIPFANVESSTRRIAALATYRMATRRYIQANMATAEDFKDTKSDQYKRMRKDIEYIIDFTQGDYTNINRPRGFRGDLAQYVLQYKMFPLVTTLMINNLPLAQKAAVLGVIGLLAGLKGEPFADDFADIYDTLMQSLGFKQPSVELGLIDFFEDIMPGSSHWIMHGGIDSIAFGGTMSSRLSMGDNIPLTGIFRPEADVGREILNAFGPAFAANADSVEWAGTVADFMIQQLGMKPRTTSWTELFRKIPQGQLRAFADAAQMGATGQILDPNGRLTSDEVNALSVFSRALGFYPLEASRANETVRLDRMHTNYMRAVRTRFVLAYAQAYVANDQDRMDRINAEVENWNDAVALTGQEDMEISNFRQAARRAGREAATTAIQRTSRGAPDYSRIDRIAEITLADTETDDE